MGEAWLGESLKEQSSQRTLQGLVELPAAGRPLVLWSAGLLSKGRAKRATESPIHLVRGAGAVGDSK